MAVSGKMSAKEIEAAIGKLELQIRDLQTRYKEAKQEEFDKALKEFLDQYDIHTAEDVARISNLIASVTSLAGQTKRPAQEQPQEKQYTAPASNQATTQQPVKPRKEQASSRISRTANTQTQPQQQQAPKPQPVQQQPAQRTPEPKPVYEEPKPVYKEPEPQPAEDDYAFDWSSLTDESVDNTVVEEQPAPTYREEEPVVSGNIEEIDVSEVITMEETDRTLEGFKKKNSVVQAEIKLVSAISQAVREGWVKKADVVDRFFGDVVIDLSSKDFYSKMGDAVSDAGSVFAMHEGSESNDMFNEFMQLPFQIRGKGAALAINDLLNYIG